MSTVREIPEIFYSSRDELGFYRFRDSAANKVFCRVLNWHAKPALDRVLHPLQINLATAVSTKRLVWTPIAILGAGGLP